MAELTLAEGSVACAFKRMKVADDWTAETESNRQSARISRKYAVLIKLKGDAFLDHADYGAYRTEDRYCTSLYPYVVGAWAGEGPPPTLDQVKASDTEELWACLREIRRLNPRLVHLPAPLPEPEAETDTPGDAPDPTTAA